MGITAAASAAALALGSASVPKVTLSAPGHTPKAGTHWTYTLSVRSGGKPVAAKLTAQIVDPIGGVHAVDFGTGRRPITNWAFKGTFSDFVAWPASSRGVPLTFRLTVRVGAAKKIFNYTVTPR